MTPARVRLVAIALIVALLCAPVGFLLWSTAVPGRSYAGPLPPLSVDQQALSTRLAGHVLSIAREPHNIGHPGALERSALYIETTLAAIGYRVNREPFDARGHAVRNLDVVIAPARSDAPTLVIGAHYDSAYDAPGANDNGSGVAAAIELARRLRDLDGKAALRIRLAFFVNEEPPFFQREGMGSLVYARRLVASGEPIAAMMSLETLGYYSDKPSSQHYPWPLDLLYPDTGNFVAFVGMTGSRALVRRTVKLFRETTPFPSQGGTAPAIVSAIDWSDHWSFAQLGVPAVMVTDTALYRYAHYHSRRDTAEQVDYARLARVVMGLESVIRRWR